MATKSAQNGVIILEPTDTYPAGLGAKQIFAVVVINDDGSGTANLEDSDGNVLFQYVGDGNTITTEWYGLGCCVSTGNGLANDGGTHATFYVYVR